MAQIAALLTTPAAEGGAGREGGGAAGGEEAGQGGEEAERVEGEREGALFDLAISCDVFVYIGDLGPTFAAICAATTPVRRAPSRPIGLLAAPGLPRPARPAQLVLSPLPHGR